MTDSDLRELDGWIAEHFLGGLRVTKCVAEDHVVDWYSGYCATCIIDYPDEAELVPPMVSSDPSAFALVKREIERRGWGWVSMRLPDVADTPYHFRIITATKELGFGEAATEELAGCRAVSRTEGL